MPYFALIIMFYHVKIACYQLSIHEMNEEDLSKTIKEGVDSRGLSFPPFPIIF